MFSIISISFCPGVIVKRFSEYAENCDIVEEDALLQDE